MPTKASRKATRKKTTKPTTKRKDRIGMLVRELESITKTLRAELRRQAEATGLPRRLELAARRLRKGGAAAAMQIEHYVRELRRELEKRQRPAYRTKARKAAARKAGAKQVAKRTATRKTRTTKPAATKPGRKVPAKRAKTARPKKSSATRTAGAKATAKSPAKRESLLVPVPAEAIQLPERLRQLLVSSGVSYDVLKHRRAYTASATAEAQHVPGMEMAKVVMLQDDDGPLMAVVPAPYRVSIEALRTVARRPELRLEHEDEFIDLFPECEVGAMPPFGNLYGIPVWVDDRLTADAFIVFNAGDHEHTVRMAYGDFDRLVSPQVAAFSVR